MLLAKKMLMGSSKTPEYIGSVTRTERYGSGIRDDDPILLFGPLDVQEGDLAIISVAATSNPIDIAWGGIPFNTLLDNLGGELGFNNVLDYVGYAFIGPTDTDPYIIDGGTLYVISALVSVFRNVSVYDSFAYIRTTNQIPDPPNLDASAPCGLWVTTGQAESNDTFIDDSPDGYTFASGVTNRETGDYPGASEVNLSYKIEHLLSDNPGEFGDNVSADHTTTITAFRN